MRHNEYNLQVAVYDFMLGCEALVLGNLRKTTVYDLKKHVVCNSF